MSMGNLSISGNAVPDFVMEPVVAENGNGNGKFASLSNLLTLVALLGSGAMAWSNLASGQSRVEERLSSIERRLDRVELDHDSLIKLGEQVQELFGMYGKMGTDIPLSSKRP